MANIQPFQFNRLPKFSHQEVLLMNSLQSILVKLGFSQPIKQTIQSLVYRELNFPFFIESEEISVNSLESLIKALPAQGVYPLFGTTFLEERFFLDLDPFLAHVVIDKLLGGSGETETASSSLTEIENGVLSYLFLKTVLEISKKGNSPVHFRLENIASSVNALKSLFKEKMDQGEKGLLISFCLSLAGRPSYARLILPFSFMENVLDRPAGMKQSSACLSQLEFLKTELWGEVGRVGLTQNEFSHLELGDVVVLEDTDVSFSQGGLMGSLRLRVGEGEGGSFAGEINGAQLKITGMKREYPV